MDGQRDGQIADESFFLMSRFSSVAAAREEYLQRRQEANQYKLRAEKQLVRCMYTHTHTQYFHIVIF